MKRLFLLAAALGLALAGRAVRAEAPAGEPVTLRGEVLDMSCYAMQEARGAKHADCARACLLKGAPAGLMTDDGAVYLLVDDHKHKKPYARLKELGGAGATVTGKLYRRGGIPIVAVESVEKTATAARADAAPPMKDMGSR